MLMIIQLQTSLLYNEIMLKFTLQQIQDFLVHSLKGCKLWQLLHIVSGAAASKFLSCKNSNSKTWGTLVMWIPERIYCTFNFTLLIISVSNFCLVVSHSHSLVPWPLDITKKKGKKNFNILVTGILCTLYLKFVLYIIYEIFVT